MDITLPEILENLKGKRKLFKQFKRLMVEAQQYNTAALIREKEREWFPESVEDTEIKMRASELTKALALVDINSNSRLTWVFNATVEKYKEVGNNFTLQDAEVIMVERDRLFGDD